ncbi:UNKNOWN [Stylonychia lemnae]|uniref:Uncharacterized protein n=1 Tax=Stylonychia lemnae TaxID=5949 RepID=A0A077ZNH9_STYLE|nr:UNKNOWN [Stylonychia lemnae]|eukprot:CDW71468.1 UNKNOWN [Stylonychia lemnae]
MERKQNLKSPRTSQPTPREIFSQQKSKGLFINKKDYQTNQSTGLLTTLRHQSPQSVTQSTQKPDSRLHKSYNKSIPSQLNDSGAKKLNQTVNMNVQQMLKIIKNKYQQKQLPTDESIELSPEKTKQDELQESLNDTPRSSIGQVRVHNRTPSYHQSNQEEYDFEDSIFKSKLHSIKTIRQDHKSIKIIGGRTMIHLAQNDKQNGSQLMDSLDLDHLKYEGKGFQETESSIGSECNLSIINSSVNQESHPQIAYWSNYNKTPTTSGIKDYSNNSRNNSSQKKNNFSDRMQIENQKNIAHKVQNKKQKIIKEEFKQTQGSSSQEKFKINTLNLKKFWENQQTNNTNPTGSSYHTQQNTVISQHLNSKSDQRQVLSKINEGVVIHKFKLKNPQKITESQLMKMINQVNPMGLFSLKDIKYKFKNSVKSQVIVRLKGQIDGIQNSMIYNKLMSVCESIEYSQEQKHQI